MIADPNMTICSIDCASGEIVCRPMTAEEIAQRELDLQAAANLPPIDAPPLDAAALIAQAQQLVAQLELAQQELAASASQAPPPMIAE